jgi:hypothetical protein
VDAFVYAMALEENDTQTPIELKLTSNEWERVELFLGLLTVRNYLFTFTHYLHNP